MPAPKKPPPQLELDAAAIDDGWSLPSEFEIPKPDKTASKTQGDVAAAAKPAPKARKRLEDWFDEIDLGWVLPDDEQPHGPPAPEEVAAGPADIDAYEEIEVTTEVEPVEAEAVEPEPVEAEAVEPEPVEAEAVEPEPVEAEAVEPEPVEAEAVEPDEPAPDDHRIDLNTATVQDLLALPGVGPKKARAIIAWRDQHERFATVADLAQVNGFGEKSVAKLAHRLAARAPDAA